MPLADQKLRILTFPQHIKGTKLDLHILLLPTQKLLNVLDTVASQLNPGTTVDLPRFITANLDMDVRTIKGLSTYPFTDALTLAAEGATMDILSAGGVAF